MPTAVVIGGGYAGVQSARLLAKRLGSAWSIQLITRSLCHELTTRLPEVASGRLSPDFACIPYARILPRRVVVTREEVVSVVPGQRMVETSDGDSIRADALLLATGSQADYFQVSGATTYSVPLKTLADPIRLRALLKHLLAEIAVPHIVIIGAGYTGTELCGELTAHFKSREDRSPRFTLVAEHNRLMPDGNPHLADLAERRLRRRGVQFRLGQSVETVERDRVVLVGGEEIRCDAIVWSAHTVAAIPGKTDNWQIGRDQRIRVDPFLRAIGYGGVYVAGDCALAYDFRRDTPVPSNAQLALQEASVAANSLATEHGLGRLQEFVPHMMGEAVSLGPRDGVAEVGGVAVTGRFAVAVKHGALFRYLTGFGDPGVLRDYA